MTMKPDLPLAANVWHEFYAASGYAPGTDVIAANRGNSTLLAYEGVQPPANSWWGWPVQVGDGLRIRAATAWIKSGAPIVLGGLQEFTE